MKRRCGASSLQLHRIVWGSVENTKSSHFHFSLSTEETHDDDDTLIIPLQKETCAAAILWRYFLASVWKNLLSTCSAKLPREPSLFLPRTRLNECLMPRVVPPHEQHNATACVTERPGIFLLTRFTQWAVGNIACYWRLLIESICCCCQE